MATNAQEQTGWGLSDRLHAHGILLGAGCPCTHPLGVTPITATGTQGRCAMGAVLNTKHFFKHRSSWNLVSHMSSGPHKCWPKLVQNWHVLKLPLPTGCSCCSFFFSANWGCFLLPVFKDHPFQCLRSAKNDYEGLPVVNEEGTA